MRSSCFALSLLLAGTLAAQTPPQRYLDWARPLHGAEVYETRRANLAQALGDVVLLVPSFHGRSDGQSFRQLDDFWYLTGLELPQSMLLLDGRTGSSTVFVPAEDPHFGSSSRPNDFPGRPLLEDLELWRLAALPARDGAELSDTLRALSSARTLAVNAGRAGPLPGESVGWFGDPDQTAFLVGRLRAEFPGLLLRNAFDAVATVRQIKGPEEIATIRAVAALTVDAIRDAAAHVRPGVTERDLEAELEAGYKRRGAQRLAFASIIKSGPNSLWPWRVLAAHYDRRNRAMQAGDLVIFDVGTELHGYVSDIGRTFPVSGRFTERQAEILRMETAVADAIIAAMKPGVTLLELMDVAREATPDEHERFMQAGLFFGHYLGLSTGDPADYTAPLAPGMVITVEPWYYNHEEGISVFTEDMVLVTETGVEVLSSGLPRTPEELEAMVGRH
ncbi:MAG: aminopeptidase P family protein [Rhodothermales bacterium]|nr:aminopeptidase P family protein [Rhodothermales bacterium]MBO6781125.1 aminopeptidase P family protein [Rhodothermales bacterium]